jgi:hypothetical protein
MPYSTSKAYRKANTAMTGRSEETPGLNWRSLPVLAWQDRPWEDTFLGIAPAGRNWLTMATMALLGGAEMIRVGIEDQFYLYPH